jgi:hypothetical protein
LKFSLYEKIWVTEWLKSVLQIEWF